MAIKWVMRWDYVAVSENVLLPNLHWTRKVFHGNQVIFSEPWNCQLNNSCSHTFPVYTQKKTPSSPQKPVKRTPSQLLLEKQQVWLGHGIWKGYEQKI
jgi:hypothetical protein